MHRLRVYNGKDMDDLHPLATMGWAAVLGAVFGLGAMIHDPKGVLSLRAIVGILIYSGGNAFIMGCAWHLYVDKNPLSTMMIAASAGLFGLPAKNVLALIFKKSGIVSIRFNNGKKDAA